MPITRRDLIRASAASALFAPAIPKIAFGQDKKNISVVHGLPANMYQAVAARFNAENFGIMANLETPLQTYEDVTQRVLRGAIAGDAPDVVFQGLNRLKTMVDRNFGQPLRLFVDSDSAWTEMGYDPATLKLGRVGNDSYGLPFAISTPVIFYNADLVRKAGGNPDKFPDNWDDIISLAKSIRSLGADTLGMHFEYFNVSGNWTFIALVQSFGGMMATADDKDVAFGGSEGLRSLEVLRGIGEVMVDMPLSQAAQAFSAGTLGMIITSSASTVQFEKAAAGNFDVRAASFPRPSSKGSIPAGGAVGMVLAKDADAKAAAWEFVKFATGPVGQTLMVKEAGYAPGNSLAVRNPELLGSFYADHPLHMAGIRQLPFATGWYSFPGQNSVKITTVIRDHLQAVVTLQKPPADALSDMVKDVRSLLPK
ncbi:extracellular solute-binding protein [Mesorhizobium delmotii]|uniref:Extracellular solute binding protein n=1 Tax=Mesorhizobium delmotii TaxID=1631247 RepID=A0A2P9AGG0_9HYPH|nr:extracellular solute-binding protein [Mesorhizobium delmotii]SJM30225.1 Extracellular solute binding protein [Mesorhizobium delmotii]